MIKNSQPFGKKFQKAVGGIFFDSHCICVARKMFVRLSICLSVSLSVC